VGKHTTPASGACVAHRYQATNKATKDAQMFNIKRLFDNRFFAFDMKYAIVWVENQQFSNEYNNVEEAKQELFKLSTMKKISVGKYAIVGDNVFEVYNITSLS
jgi:hypothetical protein